MNAQGELITGQTLIAGVVGDPIEHSLSPLIHNAWFSELGLDWVYLAFPVAGDGSRVVESMRELGLAGLNVTMPHKRSVALAADSLTGAAATLGVANTLFRSKGQIVGASTDGDGLVRTLTEDSGLDLVGLRVGVIGAGGAARGVVEALGRSGVASIRILNRTIERAESAAALAPTAEVGVVEEFGQLDLLINTTPIGMSDDSSPLPVGVITPGQVVVDIIYGPSVTPLMIQARAAGATTIGGLGMLVRQAALSFQLWTGLEPPVSAAFAALDAFRAHYD